MLQIADARRRLVGPGCGPGGGRGRRGPSPFGEPHAVGSILDQAQHFKAQALGRRQRNGWSRLRGCPGNGAQDLIFLGAEWKVFGDHGQPAGQRGLGSEVAGSVTHT
jgi:hypothetical protein